MLLGSLFSAATWADSVSVVAPDLMLTGVPSEVAVEGAIPGETLTLVTGDERYLATVDANGKATFSPVVAAEAGRAELEVRSASGSTTQADVRVLPGWVTITPPLLAILIALTLRNVIPALLIGIWLGATALRSFTPGGVFNGLLDSFQVFVTQALADPDHAAIILFSLMIGGMVGIITRNGGMTSIVRMIVSRAKSAIGGQVSVWIMGLMIFFDDYSNTLVVGNTARPMTDQLRISREKLAYIVDSTAAPVACLALITTWIGYQVGLVGEAMSGLAGLVEAPYTVFLKSIPFSFYPIFAIIFVLAVCRSGRDFGPMLKAERRARAGQVSPVSAEALPALEGDDLEPKPNIPLRAINAFLPLIVLVVALVAGLLYTGEGDELRHIIGSADAYKAMMWASFLGALTAAIITLGQRILTPHETIDAWFGGVRAMLFAMIVLVLAWALSSVTEQLHTADFLVSVLADSLPPALVPVTVFVLSGITAFTTGTSWGTMGILMPLVVPLTWAVMGVNDMQSAEHMHILYSAIACNLAGAVWGDHCSPISDTTILSSMASGCDHIEHVRTQMPYAMVAAFAAVAIGTIPAGYGFPPLLSIAIGVVGLLLFLRYVGRKVDAG